jgi:F-type H+-transporting ATPase subunit alpha
MNEQPGARLLVGHAALTMAEYFRDELDTDVLLLIDNIFRFVQAGAEVSGLLGRLPSRVGYPGDIFYIHARLLERATHLRSEQQGGSLTALPIIETQAQNVAAYIPTNLISITDGQIYLSPKLFQGGVLPAVDVGKSVSRVGGKTQLPAYRAVAGDLRLAYSQFEELEAFARFGTRLDEDTKKTLERGRRVREVFKQPQYQPISVTEQIAVLLALNEGFFDDISLENLPDARQSIRDAVVEQLSDICAKIQAGQELSDRERKSLEEVARHAVAPITEKKNNVSAANTKKKA